MHREKSSQLFEQAASLIPGGVNSPVRAFGSVGASPVFIARGAGSRIWDVDGNEYIDCVCSWGPLVLGHAPQAVVAAVSAAAANGTSFGMATAAEVELASLIRQAMPAVQMVRLVNSGTEATMSALRLARGFTGRDRIIKFEGGYHGHADGLLAKAGSGLATLGIPVSPGVPAGYAALTLTLPYGDLDVVRETFHRRRSEIAAVIVEPIAGNMGVVVPPVEFLAGLRELTREDGALLIFDEVITGFRVAYGGAQERFGIAPDLTCLGKIIGGGLPVGAYGGRREVMELLAPSGPVYQAGTLSGNPLATAAGIATLKALSAPGVYEELERKGAALEHGLREAARRANVAITLNRAGSMMTVFFARGPVTNWASAGTSSTERYAAFFHAMLEQGIFLAPSQFEAMFVSVSHTDDDIAALEAAALQAFGRAAAIP